MMMYKVLLHPKVYKFLKKLGKKDFEKIKSSLNELKIRPNFGVILKGTYYRKLRIGDYRIIYEIDHEKMIVFIQSMGRRENVYDNFQLLFLFV